jgi:Calcineurin-like phosphoesterase superfamily domain
VFGHTHKPYTKSVDGVLFINVGSVDKPKDGDPRACYALLDASRDVSIEFRRVPYDIQAVASAIRRSELPDKFATDLETDGVGPEAFNTRLREGKCRRRRVGHNGSLNADFHVSRNCRSRRSSACEDRTPRLSRDDRGEPGSIPPAPLSAAVCLAGPYSSVLGWSALHS